MDVEAEEGVSLTTVVPTSMKSLSLIMILYSAILLQSKRAFYAQYQILPRSEELRRKSGTVLCIGFLRRVLLFVTLRISSCLD